jgi:hypothetical protein
MLTLADFQCDIEELRVKLQHSVKLDHLLALADHNAVLQHARFSVPARREGYTVDDNARALVFLTRAQRIWHKSELAELVRKVLSFLLLMQEDDGRFHNLMDFSQRTIDASSIGDHLGRAIWSAGAVMNSNLPRGMKSSGQMIFDKALPWARSSTSPRTKAYACLGICERLRTEPNEKNLKDNLTLIAKELADMYRLNRSPNWKWFENILSYDNTRLSEALFRAHQAIGVQEYLSVAEESLRFLYDVENMDGVFVPVGNRGWYVKGKSRAIYDQQPIEAGGMVEASSLAYKITGSKIYEAATRKAMAWFFGLNTKSVRVYDDSTGGCFDGIGQEGLNENQGSESALAFLLATVALIENCKPNET